MTPDPINRDNEIFSSRDLIHINNKVSYIFWNLQLILIRSGTETLAVVVANPDIEGILMRVDLKVVHYVDGDRFP